MRFINEIIHKNPVLNSDEVNELCKRIKKGDRAALNKFALSNCGLIVKLLHDMHVEDQDISDMFQECFCEYLEKISRYDPARGAFSTFIYPWLKDTVKKRNTAGIPIKVLTDNAYDHPMTLREVEKLTGIGRMTVANDRDAALEKLRYYFERDGYCEDKFAA